MIYFFKPGTLYSIKTILFFVMPQGYFELQDIRTGKAPKHQKAALKGKNISNTEIVPTKRKNPKTLIGHRLEASTSVRSGRAGRFYTIYPQNRSEKIFELKFENLFEVPQKRVEPFIGLPAESLVLEWFPGINWIKEGHCYNTSDGHAMDIRVAQEAVKRGYDGIKYGDLEIQDLRHLKNPDAPLPKTVINVQDMMYSQSLGLLEDGIHSVSSTGALHYVKSHGFNGIVSIDKDVTRVPLTSIKPTQFGDEYKNESSEEHAKIFQKVIDGEITGKVVEHLGLRKEDYYPLLVEKRTGMILDGNHRHYALSAVNSPYAVVIFVTAN